MGKVIDREYQNLLDEECARGTAACHEMDSHSFTAGFAPNLLERDFTATAPNQKWSVDIAYKNHSSVKYNA